MRSSAPFGLTREEGLGLFVAVAAHAALIAALTLSPLGRKVEPPPQRMTVSFAPTVTDQSTSPKPDAQAAPDLAPDPGEAAPADQPLPVAVLAPQPKPVAKPEPKPEPKPVLKPAPKPAPAPKPEPKPVAKPKPEPKPKPKPAPPKVEPKAEAKPKPKPDTKPTHEAKPAAAATHEPANPTKPIGGHKTDDEFKKAMANIGKPGSDRETPAAKPATIASADLVSVISRQILPYWKPPSGVDVDKLIVVLAWSMNPDGTLAGNPVVVSETGETDANRAQAEVYAERAIKSVKLAAPYRLPPQAYGQWKRVSKFRFDYQLTQQEKR